MVIFRKLIKKVVEKKIFIFFTLFAFVIEKIKFVFLFRNVGAIRNIVRVGRGAKIFAPHCLKIGSEFSVGDHFWLHPVERYREQQFFPRIKIGCNFSVSDFVHIAATNKVEIGENVLLGSKVHITDHAHGIYDGINQSSPLSVPSERLLLENGYVIIKNNVWIGDGVVILANVTVGEGVIIGANSVVTKDIPDYSIAVGVPAKVIKRWCFVTLSWVKV